ncbi:site-specific DNA-methyltransferase [Myxococcota bacterium]|nr:site-specific DNA-methyltransferase [Myxococcota bacterium]
MSQKYEKLKTLLKELFQLDQPDLDFGLYRIMHAKSAEVSQFLDRDLLPQVKDAFALHQTADKAEIEKELAKVVAGIEAAGMDPEQSPKVAELRGRLKGEAVDVDQLESEVYDHLFSFFRRYYSEGDFLSKRVYKPGVYAIPYEGEEVKLHWANADQYYIKTSEYLRDYAFRLRPDDAAKPMRVHFSLVDAAEGEHGNVKAAEGKDRRFKLAESDPVAIEDGELIVRFTYQPDSAKQKDLNVAAEQALLETADPQLAEWIAALRAQYRRTDGSESDSTCLRVHLDRYTARNTFDYFIHKDLGGFLRRELDFYIKNEVMHLDDIENESAPRVEQYLSKIKVIRTIAGKIIDFLAQLEDFQKKLWLEKKFVVETSWCIRVGCIPEEFYPEIAANDAQRDEWVKLCAIDEIEGDLVTPGYGKGITSEFLKGHPTLMVDSRHLDPNVAVRLLSVMGDLKEQTDGVLVHSENFQALQLAHARYREQVKCIYIDPPYNTGDGDFPYKDSYRSSSWLAMMHDRLVVTRSLLSDLGSFVSHIDEHEFRSLEALAVVTFGTASNIGPVVWDKRNPKGDARGIAAQHEYLTWLIKDAGTFRADAARLCRPKENAAKILDKAESLIQSCGGINERSREAFREWLRTQPFSGGERAYNQIDDEGQVFRPVSMAWPNKTNAPDEYFRPLLHPLTGNPCPVPERGWRNPPATMDRLLASGLILFGPDEKTQPTRKYLLRENMFENVPSLYYFGGSDDDLQRDLGYAFPNPKPVRLAQYVAGIVVRPDEIVFDYFAGSGTTGHAVINLNREDGGQRKFILVEMGDHFDGVLIPRLKKVTFSSDWKDGKPKRLATPEEAERSPRILKVVRLESYEDALNNLEPRRSETQEQLLLSPEAQGADGLKEQYVLRYMLDVATRGSQSLLNVEAFSDPTTYTLKVKRPGSDESREVNVDLLETFDWLIGLTVQHIAAPQTFSAAFERDAEGRLRLAGRLKQDAPADEEGPFWFRTVTGTTPDGRRTLVIWRKLTGDPEQDNLVLDEWFTKQGYSSKDSEFDLIYVNGGNNLENLKASDDLWKVRLIEEDFHRLMFEPDDLRGGGAR